MAKWRVICGDVTMWQNDGELFHACLADAPYEMQFMGRSWDASGVSFDPATWRNISSWLHPGAFLFIMAGMLNDDLISVAMREAGLVKHHRGALYYQTGSSFPKSTRIDTQIDKAAGAEREVVGLIDTKTGNDKATNTFMASPRFMDETIPATPLAKIWAKHGYGSQCLKSSAESILIFRLPYSGRPVDSITGTGAGALNIELGRISTDDNLLRPERRGVGSVGGWANYSQPEGLQGTPNGTGRWPSSTLFLHSPVCRRLDGVRSVRGNGHWTHKREIGDGNIYGTGGRQEIDEGNKFSEQQVNRYACAQHCDNCGASWAAEQLEPCLHCGTGEWIDCPKCKGSGKVTRKGEPQDCQTCVGSGRVASGAATVWDCVCRVLDGQSAAAGVHSSGAATPKKCVKEKKKDGSVYNGGWMNDGYYRHPDNGRGSGASRFFHQSDYAYERIEQAAPFFYSAKAGKREKSAGLEDFFWRKVDGDFERVPYSEWLELPEKERAQGNIHPTQKPLLLCVYLARLLLPPPEYYPRRIVVPFGGKGSEAIGCLLAGWDEIVMIEQSQKYCAAAEARLSFWEAAMQEYQCTDPKEILKRSAKSKKRKRKSAQPALL